MSKQMTRKPSTRVTKKFTDGSIEMILREVSSERGGSVRTIVKAIKTLMDQW